MLSDDFSEHKELDKLRKQRNLEAANPEGWTVHTEYHWSRTLLDKRLDYWPSRNKFMFEGKVRCGDVLGFIKNREIEHVKRQRIASANNSTREVHSS
jgi:hypothetical protein